MWGFCRRRSRPTRSSVWRPWDSNCPEKTSTYDTFADRRVSTTFSASIRLTGADSTTWPFAWTDARRSTRRPPKVERRGIAIVSQPDELDKPGGGYGMRFLDPENRCIELSAGVAEHSNGWAAKSIEPSRLCHVVLNSARFDQVLEFYTDLLGFRVSDWNEDQMAFLRCSRKHHVIAFNRADHPSVNHVAYLMASVDGVMRGLANLRARGQEPDWGPGRHGPGNNIFCYYKDPAGYVSEFSSDMDDIEDEATHEPTVWRRVPERADRWGTAGPPSADVRRAMAGNPDPGWVGRDIIAG